MSTTTASPWNPPKARLAAEDSGEAIYAGFWRRFSAYWLDAVLVNVISFAITFGLVTMKPGFDLLATLVGIALAWLYYSLMHSSSRQATLGKMAFGIKVTDLEGERISFLRATGRHFAAWVSAVLLLVGFVMAAFTERKQALHDMMASTLVVRKDASPEEAAAGSGTMKLTWGVWVMIVLLGPLPMWGGIVAAISIPAYQDYLSRSKMVEVVATGNAAKSAVQQFHAKNGKLPATLEEAGFVQPMSPNVGATRLSVQGPKVVIGVMPRGMPPSVGEGEVLFTADAANPVTWTCSPGGIKSRFLPPNCRS
ncbi:hypothetical protein DSM104443_00999 [Usitatibacter rugosus]|uniref:RDD domain-containing protein n=1 Tax=Usitatibacter rugosus TaxID=2732067 RepID=A0A6M4GSX6_9PROT|nr:RDD family protein [Usitatibacter rugosus]QJR09948.1 hypothetical protein DSM104443_00999 [Usitatibacter rugosus]